MVEDVEMTSLVTIDNVTQSFALQDGGQYVALKDISLEIKEGEFVSLIGHSGCGKSTLLNLLAGLTLATKGGILMDGRQVTSPGPDRMVVFQNYSLLPWQTVRQNVDLAVTNVLRHLSSEERRELVDKQLKTVGLSTAAEKYPRELSGGMKQRVAIARALAIQPRLLLLDEPFGALDALTRGNLQQQLMQICQAEGVTTVMVTHDVDEALLLSDRVVMLTNGPEAEIGQILNVHLPRPRQRLEVMEHPDYYQLRIELIGFLQQQRRMRERRTAVTAGSPAAPSRAATVVRLGYLPGLDIAPLAMAIDSKLFDASVVQLIPESFADWRRLEDRLVEGGLDMAITSATTPLQLNLGLGSRPGQKRTPWAAITPMTVSRNGNALCLARHLMDQGIGDRASLVEWIQDRDKPFTIGIPQHHGIAELLLRHWLTAGGLNVEEHIVFTMLSPMVMVGALRTRAIDAFCAGRYRVAEAVEDRQGYVLATDLDIWSGHPEKVLTTSEAWATAHPDALVAICSGLMQAAARCDNGNQREEMTRVLSQPQWLGTRSAIALTRQFKTGLGDSSPELLRFNQFHADRAHIPNRSEGTWLLTQFSRWGWCPFPTNRQELLALTYRQDICDQALVAAGFQALPAPRSTFALADGIPFNADEPIPYLKTQLQGSAPPMEHAELPAASTR